jgi:cob(I)alamin adenosyltransferase
MVHLTRIYTKTGDEGFTDLANRERTFKTDPIVEAIGAVDEANSAIGLMPYSDIVQYIQNDLFDLGADLARSELKITEDRILWLESVIDDMNEYLEPLRSFVLPTGPIHNARSIVRRAERRVWAVDGINTIIPRYLNRLSDLLFVMARYHNKGNERLWVPGNEK